MTIQKYTKNRIIAINLYKIIVNWPEGGILGRVLIKDIPQKILEFNKPLLRDR